MTGYADALWMPSPFYTAGRNGYKPRYLILHGTAGGSSAQNIATWFQNPQAQVSAHYVVGQDGTVVQTVSEDDWAWANGVLSAGHDSWWSDSINPNWITISIEHVKPDTQNATAITPAQQDASFKLIKDICVRQGIPMQPASALGGITGHYSIDPVNRSNCPGPYPWDALWTYLNDQQQEEDPVLQLTDPLGKYFQQNSDGSWTCTQNNVQIKGAMLVYFRMILGACRLPRANEVIVNGYVYQVFEGGVMVYDPEGKIDSPPNMHNYTYLLKLDSPLALQLSGYTALLNQYNQLKAQPATQQVQTLTTQIQQLTTANKALTTKITNAQNALK